MPADLAGVVVPVLVSVVVMAGGAFAVRRYAGPAQAAYVSAIEGRLDILMRERDDCKNSMDRMRVEIEALHVKITDLDRQVRELTAENLEMRRRIAVRREGSGS